jgi:3-hydroxy-9,10-secoandrosta-1,3,5(10)-triene-9,17-dione monooxygenase
VVLLGALVIGDEGKPVDFLTILVPRSDYRIDDVWDVVGAQGHRLERHRLEDQ